MFGNWGAEGESILQKREQARREQKALLDAQMLEQGKRLDDGLSPLPRSMLLRRGRSAQALADDSHLPFRPSVHREHLSSPPNAGRASNSMESPFTVQQRNFARTHSEITRGNHQSTEDIAKKRESLVADLDEQVRERQARKLVEKMKKWEEEQEELRLMGVPQGMNRPVLPPELEQHVQKIASNLLPKFAIQGARQASYSESNAFRGRTDRESVRNTLDFDHPSLSAGPSGRSKEHSRDKDNDASVTELTNMVQKLLREQEELKASLQKKRGGPPHGDESEGDEDAKYDTEFTRDHKRRVARDRYPEDDLDEDDRGRRNVPASRVDSDEPRKMTASERMRLRLQREAEAAEKEDDRVRSGSAESGPARTLGRTVARATGGRSGRNGRAMHERDDSGSDGGDARRVGPIHGRRAQPPPSREFDEDLGTPIPNRTDRATSSSILRRRKGTDENEVSATSKPGTKTGLRPGAKGVAKPGDKAGATTGAPSPNTVKAAKGGAPARGVAPKRAPFGRTDEGAETAAARRAKGEEMARKAAEERRRALQQVKEVREAEKEAKKREVIDQKELKRMMSTNRQEALEAVREEFETGRRTISPKRRKDGRSIVEDDSYDSGRWDHRGRDYDPENDHDRDYDRRYDSKRGRGRVQNASPERRQRDYSPDGRDGHRGRGCNPEPGTAEPDRWGRGGGGGGGARDYPPSPRSPPYASSSHHHKAHHSPFPAPSSHHSPPAGPSSGRYAHQTPDTPEYVSASSLFPAAARSLSRDPTREFAEQLGYVPYELTTESQMILPVPGGPETPFGSQPVARGGGMAAVRARSRTNSLSGELDESFQEGRGGHGAGLTGGKGDRKGHSAGSMRYNRPPLSRNQQTRSQTPATDPGHSPVPVITRTGTSMVGGKGIMALLE